MAISQIEMTDTKTEPSARAASIVSTMDGRNWTDALL
jgi:hypothetical protein